MNIDSLKYLWYIVTINLNCIIGKHKWNRLDSYDSKCNEYDRIFCEHCSTIETVKTIKQGEIDEF